jgi:hypothetical protein
MTKTEMTKLVRSMGANENTITAMENAYEMGVEAEREACAKVADHYSMHDQDTPADIAEAIRARGNT